MQIIIIILFIVIFRFNNLFSQELFPASEPASTFPKGSIGIRYSGNHYKEPYGRNKYWLGARFFYGVTKNLTAIGTLSGSNHHLRKIPENLLYYFLNHHTTQYSAFPFIFEGGNLYLKYRFLSLDGPKRHFRMALFAQGSYIITAHDAAEPNLLGDNSGFGFGVISTKLLNRTAISLTTGFINPTSHKDQVVNFRSGNALEVSLSYGYRFYPKTYESYSDININLYFELFYKNYNAASILYKNQPFELEWFLPDDPFTYKSLNRGSFLEAKPSIQFIFNSDKRLDLGVAFPLINRSYLYYYPVLFFNFQKNIF